MPDDRRYVPKPSLSNLRFKWAFKWHLICCLCMAPTTSSPVCRGAEPPTLQVRHIPEIRPTNTVLFTPKYHRYPDSGAQGSARQSSDIPVVIVLTRTLWAVSLEVTVTGSLQLSSKVTRGKAVSTNAVRQSNWRQIFLFPSDHQPGGQEMAGGMADKARRLKTSGFPSKQKN